MTEQTDAPEGAPAGSRLPWLVTGALALTVLIFVSTECPVSNRYAPEITRLHAEFARRGFHFRLVYPNPADQDAAIRQHLEAYRLPALAERDPAHRLVTLAGATVTPEAAVFDAAGRLVYRGRIDDRYIDFGKDRHTPTQRDLENALDAALAGTPIAVKQTQAIGCILADLVK